MTKSLVRFLLERHEDEMLLILSNTPVFGVSVTDSVFEQRYLDRGALVDGLRSEQLVLKLVVEAMREEQGDPPAPAADFEAGPVTNLGSHLLKLMAWRYRDHPDYDSGWRPAEPPR